MSIETATVDGYAIHRDNDTFIDPGGWGGLGTPEVRTVRQARPRAHGALDATSLYGPRVMPVRGWCGDPEAAGGAAAAVDAFDALKAALSVEASHLFVIRREGRSADEQFVARLASDVSGESLAGGTVIRFGFELVAQDPLLYGTVLSSATRSGAGNVTATVSGGTFPTWPILEVQGVSSAGVLTITNSTHGGVISLTLPALGGSDVVSIDTLARTVTDPTGDLQPGYVNASATDWWRLWPGGNTVALAGAAVGAGTDLTVRWRSARI